MTEKSLCVFKTHNQAVAAWGHLKRAGIDCTLVRTPQNLAKEKTCSYSVSFSSEYSEKARTILQKNTLDFYIV